MLTSACRALVGRKPADLTASALTGCGGQRVCSLFPPPKGRSYRETLHDLSTHISECALNVVARAGGLRFPLPRWADPAGYPAQNRDRIASRPSSLGSHLDPGDTAIHTEPLPEYNDANKQRYGKLSLTVQRPVVKWRIDLWIRWFCSQLSLTKVYNNATQLGFSDLLIGILVPVCVLSWYSKRKEW